MLENLAELFQQTLNQEEPSITEKLEEINTSNSSERHLLEYEEQHTETMTKAGLDYSFTLLVNSTTTWLIFNQLKFITPDFSGVFFHLFIIAVALLMNLPYLTEKVVNRKYLIVLTSGRLLISLTINSRVISTIDSKVASSKLAYDELRTEVKNYENKLEKNDSLLWGYGDIIFPIVGGFLLMWVLKLLFNKKEVGDENG